MKKENTTEVENKKEINKQEKLAKKEEKKKAKESKLPKDISQDILKRVFKNVMAAIGLMVYFIIINVAFKSMQTDRLLNDLKVFSATFLIVGIVFLEKAYKTENGKKAIMSIELLVLSAHTLSIMHVITIMKFDFQLYMLTSSYIFSIYYVLKSIVLYTKGKMQFLKGMSDIPEILKEDEPQIKEATKKTDKKPKEKKEEKESVKIDTISKGEKPKEEKEKNKKEQTKTTTTKKVSDKKKTTAKSKKNTSTKNKSKKVDEKK